MNWYLTGLLFSFFSFSISTPFKLECLAKHDSVIIDAINEHVIRVHTAAFEDEYYRIDTNVNDQLNGKLVFEGYKKELNGKLSKSNSKKSLQISKNPSDNFSAKFVFSNHPNIIHFKSCQMRSQTNN